MSKEEPFIPPLTYRYTWVSIFLIAISALIFWLEDMRILAVVAGSIVVVTLPLSIHSETWWRKRGKRR